jgi:hypothetical protein
MRQAQKILNLRAALLSPVAVLGLGLALGGLPMAAVAQSPAAASAPSPAGQQSFASAGDAVNALVKALQANDPKSLLDIFGPGGEKLVASGDPVADAAARQKFLALYAESHVLTPQPDGSVTLVVGNDGWPMPIPIVQAGGNWQFDATTGAQDIVDRRIGRNELLTIQTLLSAVAAEQDYFERTKEANGTGVYAQRLYSTPGQHDGLYWDAAAGEPDSPMGPFIAQAEDEGYPGAAQKGVQTPYHGYYFHLLKYQGPDAPGGFVNYIQNGKMTGGFAFMAWPVAYGSSGIMTFIVDQDGVVFQKDLGPQTLRTVATITAFDPDLSWARIDVSN